MPGSRPLALSLIVAGVLLATPRTARSLTGDHGAWIPAPTPGADGLKREDAAAAYDPVLDRVWLHGGFLAPCLTGDLWALDLGDEFPVWRTIVAKGEAPLPRSRHTATYDPLRRRLIVYGGLIGCGDSLGSDVWQLSLDGMPEWTRLAPEGDVPIPREDQTAVYDPVRDRIVYFGGFDAEPGDLFTDETWALHLAGATRWERIEPEGTGPTARWQHTAVYDALRDRMLVFGGDLRDATVYALDFATNEWSLLPIKGVGITLIDHGALYDPARDRMVVTAGFAGFLGSGSEVWALALSGTPGWSLLQPATALPAARRNHATVYDSRRDRVIVHGGDTGKADTWALALAHDAWTPLVVPFPRGALAWTAYDRARNRLIVAQERPGFPMVDRIFAYDLGAQRPWAEILPDGPAPPTRRGASAVYDPVRDRVVLFGGSAAGEELAASNETWSLWLGTSPRWERSMAPGAPQGRRGHAAVYDARRDRMLVIAGLGGYVESGLCAGSPLRVPEWRADTWAWSLANEAWSFIAPAGESYGVSAVVDSSRDRALVYGGVHESVFCRGDELGAGTSYEASSVVRQLALDGGAAWTPVSVTGSAPPARYDATAIVDPARKRMVVFGGQQRTEDIAPATFFDDTWALDLSSGAAWEPLVPTGTPPLARAGAGGAYEPGRSKLWLYGGQGVIGHHDLWTLAWDHTTPTLMDVEEAVAGPAGVRIVWRVELVGAYEARVERTRDGAAWAEVARPVADSRGRLVFEDADVRPGERLGYRLRLDRGGQATFSSPEWLEIPAAVAFRLSPAGPNPTRGDVVVELGVPPGARVRLAVFDVLGRRVVTRDVAGLEAGTHRITLAPRSRLRAGVYLIQATLGGRVLRGRVVVLD